MVPNPSYHPKGDFTLAPQDDRPSRIGTGGSTLTYGNIGMYDTALFRELPRGVKLRLLPLLLDWIGAGPGERRTLRGSVGERGTPADLARLDASLAAVLGDSR